MHKSTLGIATKMLIQIHHFRQTRGKNHEIFPLCCWSSEGESYIRISVPMNTMLYSLLDCQETDLFWMVCCDDYLSVCWKECTFICRVSIFLFKKKFRHRKNRTSLDLLAGLKGEKRMDIKMKVNVWAIPHDRRTERGTFSNYRSAGTIAYKKWPQTPWDIDEREIPCAEQKSTTQEIDTQQTSSRFNYR